MGSLALALSLGCSVSHEPIPEDAPLPGDLLEIDLTDAEREALCDWWMRRHGWPETTIYQCPPPPADPIARANIGCGTVRRAEYPDCPVRVQDWYNCELSEPYWWCRRPIPEVCTRSSDFCGSTRFRP